MRTLAERPWLFIGSLAGLMPVIMCGVTPDGAALAPGVALGAGETGLLVSVVDARTGQAIPARLRVEGTGLTADPALGVAGNVVVTTDGEGTLRLPPGRYEVVASRGPEWSIATARVRLGSGHVRAIDLVLRREVDPGDWVACDFHLHAEPSSDSAVTLGDRVASLVAEGVRFAVPTDHNHVTDYGPAIADLAMQDELGSVPGVEVTTWVPDFGHFNVFPAPPEAPRYWGMEPGPLFEALHALGPDVIVQVNHPRLGQGVGYFDRMRFDPVRFRAAPEMSLDFDAIEVWNGFDNDRLARVERNLDEWRAILEHGVRVVAVGNSDSHRVDRQWAGYPRTYVRVPGGGTDDPIAVVRALRAGHAFVTDGPFVELTVDGRGPGETVTPSGGAVTIEVRVQAPEWMDVSGVEILDAGGIVDTATLRGGERRVRLRLPVRGPGFLVAVVRGRRTMDALLAPRRVRPFAFTNPVWIDG